MHRVAVLICVLAGCSPDSDAPRVGASLVGVAQAQSSPAATEVAVAAVAVAPTLPLDPMTLPGSASTSVGAPSDGRLLGGIALPSEAPGFLSNERRPNRAGHHGTVEVVQAILRAAAVVDRELPGSRLVVNDISLPEGGPIVHHGSHESGRDADILFYLLDRRGAPFPSKGVPLDPEGKGFDFADLVNPADDVPVKLDVPRTWRFLRALAEDPTSAVQRVFIAEHLRTLLVAHADQIRAPRAVRNRVEAWTCQPSTPHDDHMHIRFFCSAEDIVAGCEDSYPIYPWHKRALAALGVEPVQARARRRDRSRTLSRDEALSQAGPMHRKVREFLARREAWSIEPHPGRPWCR